MFFHLRVWFHGNEHNAKIRVLRQCFGTSTRPSLPRFLTLQMFYLCGEVELRQWLCQLGEPGQFAAFLWMSMHFNLPMDAVARGAFDANSPIEGATWWRWKQLAARYQRCVFHGCPGQRSRLPVIVGMAGQ